MKFYFNNCGSLVEHTKRNSIEFVVSSSDIIKYIKPHIMKYPIYGTKWRSFQALIEILFLLNKKQEIDFYSYIQVIKISAALNYSLRQQKNHSFKTKIKRLNNLLHIKLPDLIDLNNQEFKDFFPLVEPNVKQIQDQFIIGLIDGDGCFNINFKKNAIIRFGFQITGDLSNKRLFEEIKNYLNCGSIQQEGNKNILVYKVTGTQEIKNKIIPFMEKFKHKLHTDKKHHFEIFKQAILKRKKAYTKFTQKEILDIIDIGYNINFKGRGRKYTKQEYIDKYIK